MSDVVFALRRNASTDPPGHADTFITDDGARYYEPGFGWQRSDIVGQPSWWYDLRPTEGEGLTTEHLRGACYLADAGLIAAKEMGVTPPDGWEPTAKMLTRVRAALDALNVVRP